MTSSVPPPSVPPPSVPTRSVPTRSVPPPSVPTPSMAPPSMPAVPLVRELGRLTESIHAVVYFAPETQQRYLDLGLRGYWRGYFASRTAAFFMAATISSTSSVGPQPITGYLGGFAASMIERAIPQVWAIASPSEVLAARLDGAVEALHRLIPERRWQEYAASEVAHARLESGQLSDRPLAAAQVRLPRPTDPLGALWHDCTVLREHRGDGHLLAIAESGMSWPEPHLLLGALGHLDARQRENRGWSEAEWDDARLLLIERELLEASGQITPAGSWLAEAIELRTDELAAAAYQGIDLEQLATKLRPLATRASAEIPFPNAMGLRASWSRAAARPDCALFSETGHQ